MLKLIKLLLLNHLKHWKNLEKNNNKFYIQFRYNLMI